MRYRMTLVVAVALAAALVGAAAPQQSVRPQPPPETPQEFLRAADEVLAEMSQLLELPVKHPLAKSLRTKDEVRAYLVRKFEEDEEPAKRYADRRALEALGLIPRGFDLDAFLLELLTEQIAGLYDTEAKEFYVVAGQDQDMERAVMAHELAHALHDQHFEIDKWVKAARPNDDAQLARGAVLEGAAMAAMFDYLFREGGLRVRDLPDLRPLMEGNILAEMGSSPQFARAPGFLRDALVFPYVAGVAFAQAVLKQGQGWSDFNRVFTDPPVSSQQILHPELYLQGVVPEPVELPSLGRRVPRPWKKLDENLLGEFGLHAVLKQFLGRERADALAPAWAGDRYAIFEHPETKQALLVVRLRLAAQEKALSFFGQYSEALELKYETRSGLFRRPNFFSFATPDHGEVFLYCRGVECLTVEGAGREVFDAVTRALGWPAAPRPAQGKRKTSITEAQEEKDVREVKEAEEIKETAPLSGSRFPASDFLLPVSYF